MQADKMEQAPDFTLADISGIPISLKDFKGKANVVLVLNRGFL
jgi:peroxiredoxin